MLIFKHVRKGRFEVRFGERIEKRLFDTLKKVMADTGATKGFIVNSGQQTYQIDRNLTVISVADKGFPTAIFK
jgi:hypothetical protein